MKIAQVAPLYESVPPKLYGGTERVVSYLTEELVRQGHEVTLFASGDSTTSAFLLSPCQLSLRLDKRCEDQLSHHIIELEMVASLADQFDIIHYHIDYLHYPMSRRIKTPHVTTLHGRLTIPDLVDLYRVYDDVPLVSISNSQRTPLPWVNWVGTVYHGLPAETLVLRERPSDYLAFIGRFSEEKRPDRAIEIARRAGMKLKLAAKIDKADQEYFDREIAGLLDPPMIEYVGEINEDQKGEFLGGARALLFPIDWPEPFGLVMIEAMACGTPVIAWPCGSVPEIINQGKTGFIVDSIDAAVEAVRQAEALDRRTVREGFNERFSAARMARDYVNVYRRLIEAWPDVREPRLRATA